MIRIFFDQSRPDLIFSIAAIIDSDKEATCLLIPVDLQEDSGDLLEEVYAAQQKYTAANAPGQMLADGLPERIFLFNIGPKPGGRDQGFMRFLLNHEAEIALWADGHDGWKDDEIIFANRRRPILRLGGYSYLHILEDFGYNIPLWWKETETSMLSTATGLAKNQDASRYCGAFWINKVIYSNIKEGNLMTPFQEAVWEILNNEYSEALDELYALVPKMIRKTNQAKNEISSEAVWFQGARQKNRPVGYLRLENVPKYLDLDDILSYGQKQFPWLFVMDYTFKGQEYLHIKSAIITDIEEIWQFYNAETKDKDTLFGCLNNEVVRRLG